VVSAAKRSEIENEKAARIGDVGDCRCPHGGIYVIVTGASRTITENSPNTRLGDRVVCVVCGDVGTLVTSAQRTYIE